MSTFSRRNFLRAGGAGLFAGMCSSMVSPARALARLSAGPGVPTAPNERLFVIYLRGGMDGVFSVVPIGDANYPGQRGSIYVPPASTVRLKNSTYATLHQNLIKLGNHNDPSTPDQRGHAGWLHCVGNPSGKRSHFVEQQITESADDASDTMVSDEGWVPRLGFHAGFPATLPAASVSRDLQLAFRSSDPQHPVSAHVKSIAQYTFGTDQLADRQRDALMTHLGQPYAKPIAEYVDAVATFARDSEPIINGIAYTPDGVKFPRTDAEATAAGLVPYGPGKAMMADCEELYHIMVNTTCQVGGVQVGNWDSHNSQVPQRARADTWLGHAIRSLYDLTVAHSYDFTFLVITEFGRTDAVNSSDGTDHGDGGLMMAFGRNVNGGVYNCHNGGGLGAIWTPMGTTGDNARPVKTDFRTVYAELFEKRFGMNIGQLDDIIPGWQALANAGLPEHQYLNFIS